MRLKNIKILLVIVKIIENILFINKLLTEYFCNQYNVNHKITSVILE
jgi:hypothetical protein